MATVGSPARFVYVTPQRLFDTRQAAASTRVTRGNGTATGPLTAGTPVNVVDASGVVSGATALWLNVAAVPQGAPGFFVAYPKGASQPPTSSVNFAADVPRANAVPVALGAGGDVAFFASTQAHAIADLFGAFKASGAGMTAVAPSRVLDTRSTQTPIAAATVTQVDVQAPAGATGVVASVAVLPGAEPGFLTAFPCGTATPATSNVNYAADTVTANTVVSQLGTGRKLCVWSLKAVDLIVDVTGYLSDSGPLSYQVLTPKRLLDTRGTATLYTNRLADEQTLQLPIQTLPGMPTGVWSAVLNITAVDATQNGHVTAYPCGGSVPNASSLNFRPGSAFAALSVTSVGNGGKVCLFAKSRTHLIVDLVGVWVHTSASSAPPPPTDNDPGDEGDPVEPTDPVTPVDEDPPDTYTPPDTAVAPDTYVAPDTVVVDTSVAPDTTPDDGAGPVPDSEEPAPDTEEPAADTAAPAVDTEAPAADTAAPGADTAALGDDAAVADAGSDTSRVIHETVTRQPASGGCAGGGVDGALVIALAAILALAAALSPRRRRV
ncbi:MAG: hypothetical protein H6745_00110 [Deltaproteobacteria bacterium]|nr:hypothetical protein [Deltaproteobacteria bacterium]